MATPQTWRSYLQQELKSRRGGNPRYSLRSFARDLKISPTQLSMILSGKRVLKAKMALHLTEVLGLTSIEMMSMLQEKTSRGRSKSSQEIRVLKAEEFTPVASWHYYAILGLAGLHQNVADPVWIAKKLDIPVSFAETCFKDLIRLQHICIKDGQFRQTSSPLRTTDDIPAMAIRRYHKQSLQLAAQKIDSIDVELREYNSMTIPINPRNIPVAKKMIREFKEAFTLEIGRGRKTEVYDLCIQFFPLTGIKTPEKRK